MATAALVLVVSQTHGQWHQRGCRFWGSVSHRFREGSLSMRHVMHFGVAEWEGPQSAARWHQRPITWFHQRRQRTRVDPHLSRVCRMAANVGCISQQLPITTFDERPSCFKITSWGFYSNLTDSRQRIFMRPRASPEWLSVQICTQGRRWLDPHSPQVAGLEIKVKCPPTPQLSSNRKGKWENIKEQWE